MRFDTPRPTAIISPSRAGIAQLVERNLAKVEVASSRLVSRSKFVIAFRKRRLPRRPKGFWSFRLTFGGQHAFQATRRRVRRVAQLGLSEPHTARFLGRGPGTF